MLNVYDFMKDLPFSKRLIINELLFADYKCPMNLEEYARLSGRSLSTFKRDFKDIYNTTPGKWLTQKRLEHGRYLLKQTDKSVTEVVLDSGFKNNSHFSRVFKEEYGITPVQQK